MRNQLTKLRELTEEIAKECKDFSTPLTIHQFLILIRKAEAECVKDAQEDNIKIIDKAERYNTGDYVHVINGGKGCQLTNNRNATIVNWGTNIYNHEDTCHSYIIRITTRKRGQKDIYNYYKLGEGYKLQLLKKH